MQRVKEKRIEKGFSQIALANALDINQGFIAKIESGKYDKKYNPTHLNELAKILGCSPRDFMPEKAL